MTIEELKVGSRVMFGNYGVNSDRAHPIWWVKATKDCDFITESVLDYLMFDAKEPNSGDYGCRNYGNPNYNLSNIRQFLNSEDEDWYIPQHAADNWPNSRRQDSLASYGDPGGTYRDHHGFLRHFEDYEIEALASQVELPSFQDVNKFSHDRFELFKKKGVRPHATSDMVWRMPNCHFDEYSFVDFWTQDRSGERVTVCDRTGNATARSAATACGLRPKCKIRGNIEVEVSANSEGFLIVPFEAKPDNVVTDEELFAFLGLR